MHNGDSALWVEQRFSLDDLPSHSLPVTLRVIPWAYASFQQQMLTTCTKGVDHHAQVIVIAQLSMFCLLARHREKARLFTISQKGKSSSGPLRPVLCHDGIFFYFRYLRCHRAGPFSVTRHLWHFFELMVLLFFLDENTPKLDPNSGN